MVPVVAGGPGKTQDAVVAAFKVQFKFFHLGLCLGCAVFLLFLYVLFVILLF